MSQNCLVCRKVKDLPVLADPSASVKRHCAKCNEEIWVAVANVSLPFPFYCYTCGMEIAKEEADKDDGLVAVFSASMAHKYTQEQLDDLEKQMKNDVKMRRKFEQN